MKKILLGLVLFFGIFAITSAASPVYPNSDEFLKAEGKTCKVVTDGCNTVQIWQGELGAMTQMYCENIYGDVGQEAWSCLDETIEEETLGFLSENDRNQYKILQTQIDKKNQERITGLLDSFGNNLLEKNSWNVSKSVQYTEKVVRAFETAIFELSMKTPAYKAMSKTDTKNHQVLNFAKFELQIMMHRWMRNARITETK